MTNVEATLLGAVIGGTIAFLGTYFGAIKISDRERHIKIFNDTAEALRNALIKTQQRLANAKVDRSKPNDIKEIAIDIIKENFTHHDELARRFQLCITDKDTGFTKTWNNYQYWYDKVACQGTTDKQFPEHNLLKDVPEFQQALKAIPYELIQNVIENTKHK